MSMMSDKRTWLANEILVAFLQEVSGLKFYLLECEGIHFQRIFPDVCLGPQIGIIGNTKNWIREVEMVQGGSFKLIRVIGYILLIISVCSGFIKLSGIWVLSSGLLILGFLLYLSIGVLFFKT